MRKSVFLDRDGVINKLVFNPATGEYESPHYVEDLEIYPWIVTSLKRLIKENYLLFLVSNQPSFAKGKTSLENIKEIHNKLHTYMLDNGIKFSEYYYCYHHPDGIVDEFKGKCECRKPSPYFLLKASREFDLNMNKSWFVGDRDTDILCGQSAGVRTILINEKLSEKNQGKTQPDFFAYNLIEAVDIIGNEGRIV